MPPPRAIPRATSAFTSGRSQLPGAGCTTSPAGLSITRGGSSAHTTAPVLAALDAAGVLGTRVVVERGPWSHVHLADHLADAVIVAPEAAKTA